MPVAVVTAACELPESKSLAQLWQTILHGRRCFREIPSTRLCLSDYAGSGPDSIYHIEAALLENYSFDRARFRIPLPLFDRTDISHWLALDVATRALEPLGIKQGSEQADRTAVIVANTLTGEFSRANLMRYRWPYVERVLRRVGKADAEFVKFLQAVRDAYCSPFPPPDEDSLAGALTNTIAGRIANFHGLRGGAHTVDGACASSLVAIVSACEKLAVGDVDCVVVGAVDLSLDPFELVGFARNGALARDVMRVFDARSSGFWPGEGCGFVVLATEETTRRNGWPMLAWIAGAAMSTDGTGSLTLPTAEGQLLASRRAWQRAGLDPREADYFEAHGTGTAVGDPIELQGLARLVAGECAQPVAVGSIKAQVGHTKAAAGMAGLLKALTMCGERVIPATVGCDEEHSVLATLSARVAPAKDTRPIGHCRAVTVGINSFGFGGVNCHVVLQGMPLPAIGGVKHDSLPRLEREDLRDQLFLLQAQTRDALASRLLVLESRARTLSHAQLVDLAADVAARLGRDLPPQFSPQWRASIVASTPHKLHEACVRARASLSAVVALERFEGERFEWAAPPETAPKVALVFPGQGNLMSIRPLDWCARFPLLDEYANRIISFVRCDVKDTSTLQPVLAESAIAALTLFEALGIHGEVVMGHSFGELSALHAAGVLDARQFRQLACDRGACMRDHGQAGAMVALNVDVAEAERLADAFGLDVACINGARAHVLAGEAERVRALLGTHALRVVAQLLPSALPFHSRRMGKAAEAFRMHIPVLTMARARRQVISTVTGSPIAADTDLSLHLCNQFTQPVRFSQALSHAECDLVIDMGMGASLSSLLDQKAGDRSRHIDLFGRTMLPLLQTAGAYWVRGGTLNFATLFAQPGLRSCGLDDVPTFLASPCGVAETDEAVSAIPMASAEDASQRSAAAEVGPEVDIDTAATLQAVLAEVTGLERTTLNGGARLLSDLHLNSIKARHAIAIAARRLGIAQVPFDLALLARATVDDTVAWLDGLLRQESASAGVPEGIEPWMRVMSHDWVDVEPPRTRSVSARDVRVITLRSHRRDAVFDSLLQAAQQCAATPGQGLLVLQDAQLANGFLRSMAHEYPDRRICAVEFDHHADKVREAAHALHTGAERGYAELRFRGAQAQSRVLKVARKGNPQMGWQPQQGDVALFAGGARGIGSHVTLGVAASFGCKVAVIGRSSPEEPEVVQFMADLREIRADAAYVQANLESHEQTARAVREIETSLGPITALFHAAGRNEPKVLAQLVAQDIEAAVRAKVHTLENLLANIRVGGLKALVSFGSIIGELGFAGEAHYALANEWLHGLLREVATKAPHCLVLPLGWSAWSVGMAARMPDVRRSLERSGVRLLESDEAVQVLLRVLRNPPPDRNLIPCGRFRTAISSDANFSRLRHWRFLEEPRVAYEGIELIADAVVSTDTDRYLQDHAPGGLPLMPLVMAMEAMASAAVWVGGREDAPTTIEGLTAHEPIAFEPGQRVVLRTMALLRTDGNVQTEVRCDLTGFTVRHFSASIAFGEVDAETPTGTRSESPPLDIDATETLYGGVCFHGPRFRRIDRIAAPRALVCVARTRPAYSVTWFSSLVPPQLLIGDPGVRDAALHALQICVPHDAVFPVEVERIRLGKLQSCLAYDIRARQVAQEANSYVFDVELTDPSGAVTESWQGLKVRRAASDAPARATLPAELLPAMLERLCADALGESGVKAGSINLGRVQGATEEALRRAIGQGINVVRGPNGRLRCEGFHASSSHTDTFTIAVARPVGPLAVDLQLDPCHPVDTWQTMLQPQRSAFARKLEFECGLATGDAHIATWCMSECLSKLGLREWPTAAIRVHKLHAARAAPLFRAGWGGLQIVAGAVDINMVDAPGPLWFALALQDDAYAVERSDAHAAASAEYGVAAK